ncbi:DnaJ C-terminal domain-containing protein [Caballeronia choica]|uniref:DnaJ C-terminal domain-containing protein n=1 Tax=Caballeronia choica TaxID=326476 RepID=UPI001F41C0AC|nr:DnaJ C-terminal domain-containing protein [Caballeronia choica]
MVIDLEDAYRGARRSISPTPNSGRRCARPSHAPATHGRRIDSQGRLCRAAPSAPGQGGAALVPESAGDLYLEIAFREHPRFHIDRRDVSIELPLGPWEAALGAQVTVRHRTAPSK